MEKKKMEDVVETEESAVNLPNTCKIKTCRYPGFLCGRISPNVSHNGGYMTIFSCLLFLVMLSLIFLCLDGIVIHQADSRSKTIAVGAGEHILANYNVPLAKRYHLYFLDSEMEDKISDRVEKYYKCMLMPSTSGFLKKNPLLRMSIKEIRVESFGTMQEQKCLYLRHQIREYMKYDSTKDLLLNTINRSAEQMKSQTKQMGDMRQVLEEKETAVSEAEKEEPSNSTFTPSEMKAREEAAASAKKKDPRKTVRKIIKSGVLGFVTTGRTISKKQISPISLPSGSQKEKNLDFSRYSFNEIKEIKNLLKEPQIIKPADLLEASLACNYIKKHFNSYGKEEPIENTVLNYEMEYIIGGQESDKQNLRYTVNRLIVMRCALNFVYAMKDPELNSEALTMATALAGILGLPPVIEGIKYTILGAVSFAEALIDVQNLLKGEKVPIIKTKASWNLSVTDVSTAVESESGTDESGLLYEEYLALLLLTQPNKNRMYLRMQDLMQVNICQEQPEFQIEKCRFGFKMDAQTQVKTWFGHGSYKFNNNRTFSY